MKNLFTEREQEVLGLVVKGMSNMEIAQKLNITIYTTKAHIGSILRKINGKNRIDIVLFAIDKGYIGAERNNK